MFTASLIFWFVAVLVVYHHVLYPVLLRSLAARRRGRVRFPAGPSCIAPSCPSITIIVPAHNEAGVIAAKIRNLNSLAYPADKLHVVLALDGCTDDTAELARNELAKLQQKVSWRVVEYSNNIGKVAVLNDTISACHTAIIAVSDASAMVGPDALLRAAAHFGNPKVGVVCGTYRIQTPGSEGERTYWDYQTMVKADEAALAAPMGAHGAFYLFRRQLWTRLPADTINDDFILPMRIVLEGQRAVYDKAIVAVELEQSSSEQDFRRRVRIGAGNLQQVLRLIALGDPRRGWIAFVFLSGKGLRAAIPVLLLAAALSTVVLASGGSTFYTWVLLAEIAGPVIVYVWKRPRPRPIEWAYYLIAGHIAAAIGYVLLFTGKAGSVWRSSSLKKDKAKSAREHRL